MQSSAGKEEGEARGGQASRAGTVEEANAGRRLRWWGYLIFGLLSLVLSAISVFFWMFNLLTVVFLHLAAPAVSLLGYDPLVEGWSSLGSTMLVSALWPLTLAPLYWLNFRVLRWKAWGYAGLFLVANVIIAFVVLLKNASA